jgi:hypothetical protein
VALTGPQVAAMAQNLLDLITLELEGQGIDLPSVQYVAPGGAPAVDGPQLTVCMEPAGFGESTAMDTPSTSYTPPFMTLIRVAFTVMLIRAVPVGRNGAPPTTDKLNAAGIDTIGDAAGLLLAGEAIKGAYSLLPANIPMTVGPVVPYGPEGGVSGASMHVSWVQT